MREWVPHGRRARACVCGDGQTPHVSVTSLLRAVKAAEPGAADWWYFECRCGRHTGASNLDGEADTDQPEGELFECSGCGSWGHLGCYPHYASRQRAEEEAGEAVAGEAATGGEAAAGGEAAMHCVRCTDAWRDREQEEWSFSCVCGRNEGATARSFEAPSGRMFECHGCSRWAHTECFADYKGLDDDALPETMRCHRCRTPGAKSPR